MDEEVNILVILEKNPFVASNAANNRFIGLAEGLAENGCHLDLAILNPSPETHLKELEIHPGLSCLNLLAFGGSHVLIRKFLHRFLPARYYVKKILNLVKTNDYDFVWLGVSPLIVQIGIELFRHNLNLLYFHERSEYSWIGLSGNKKIHDKYLKEFLPKINILAAMTSKLGSYYKEYIDPKTHLIHLPMTVDFARFETSMEDNQLNKPYIAYCGAMNNPKDGVDVLIRSFIKIKDRFQNLHLYLVGPLTPERDYEAQQSIITENKAADAITYLGNLSKEEIPTFLSNARVLAMARPKSKQAEGGFPTKLGEYLATGKPVCLTSVGEIGEYLEDNKSAFIAEPGSVDSFADALMTALQSDNADAIGSAGREVAKRYFNKDIQAEKLYHFLLKKKAKA